MAKIGQTLTIYVVIGILNTAIFIQYLKTTGLPGGEVGMAPFIVMIDSLIALVIAIIGYCLISLKVQLNLIYSVLVYQLTYLLILLGYEGVNPFIHNFNDPFEQIDLAIVLISFVVIIGLLLAIGLARGLKKAKRL
jgi:hypothetical protein